MSQDKMRAALQGAIDVIVEQMQSHGHSSTTIDSIVHEYRAALSEPPEPADRERIIEECAKVCEQWTYEPGMNNLDRKAQAEAAADRIRALKTIPSQTTQRDGGG